MTAPTPLPQLLKAEADAVSEVMQSLLPRRASPEAPLFEAMRYAALAPGKKLRPFLVLASAQLFAVPRSRALRVAAAVEFIHAYSLVHDDLPAMDNADTRRGLPSTHKAFGEAVAILAGDALLTLAFEVLAHPATHEDGAVRADLIAGLAKAIGPEGMVAGQMLDMLGDRGGRDQASIARLQRLKTGELIAFSAVAGALLGRADSARRAALRAYAHDLGLAFQITDDVLDATADPEALGKPVGQDASKATFVALLGLERAREQARHLTAQAQAHLAVFEGRAQSLADLAEHLLSRRS